MKPSSNLFIIAFVLAVIGLVAECLNKNGLPAIYICFGLQGAGAICAAIEALSPKEE